MRFWLRGCGGNQPRVNGTAVIAPSQGGVFYFDFAANSSGNVSGTLYSTRDVTGLLGGDITCGTSTTSVWYGMQVFVGGKGGPEIPVHALNTATLNISSVTPITVNPIIAAPTGDGTYIRKDGGNNPVTGNLQFQGTQGFTNLTVSGTGTLATINGIQYVDGVTNTTVLQAMNKLPSTGGTVYIPCSTTNYTWPVAPTNGYSNVALVSMCSKEHPDAVAVQGLSPNNVQKQVVLTMPSGSTTLTSVQNFHLDGITLAFAQNGGNFVLNSSSYNDFDYVTWDQCADTTVPCVQIKTTGTGAANNAIENAFNHARIICNQATNHYCTAGIQVIGTGPLVTGSFATLNKFWDTNISGNFQGCVDMEINSDTNFWWRLNCGSTASVSNSYILGFNLVTPASDQDADGDVYDDVIFGGSPTSIIRAGQCSGSYIKMSVPGGGMPSFTNLGGTPTWTIQVIGLGAQPVNFVEGGTITASAITGGGPATGAAAGDISAISTATLGNLFLGNDGQKLFRNGANVFLTSGLGFGLTEQAGGSEGAQAGFDICYSNNSFHNIQCTYNGGAFFTLPLSANNGGGAQSGLSQTKRAVAGCTTAASIGGICATDITVTWGTAFADANYSVSCIGNAPTNVPAAPFITSGTKLAGSVHINYFAITAAAASYASIDCTAVHD